MTISRPYRDKTIEVRVLADGFQFDGAHFKTLTAVARRATGQHLSGYRFFGFAPRKRKEEAGDKK